jgi:DNA-binding NarL/FixJ family response regulator
LSAELTPREAEIFGYLLQGRSLPYISEKLFISNGTVRTHVRNIYKKLKVHSRQELIDLIDFEGDRLSPM